MEMATYHSGVVFFFRFSLSFVYGSQFANQHLPSYEEPFNDTGSTWIIQERASTGTIRQDELGTYIGTGARLEQSRQRAGEGRG